jgi:hypothetical protein
VSPRVTRRREVMEQESAVPSIVATNIHRETTNPVRDRSCKRGRSLRADGARFELATRFPVHTLSRHTNGVREIRRAVAFTRRKFALTAHVTLIH